MIMEKFTILQRYFDTTDPKKQFRCTTAEYEDRGKAEDLLEEMATNYSQEWLMSEDELEQLKIVLLGKQEEWDR